MAASWSRARMKRCSTSTATMQRCGEASSVAASTIAHRRRRQGAELVGRGMGMSGVGLLDADLDVAGRNGRGHQPAFDDRDLALDLIVDAELLEQSGVERAGARVGVADRLGI